MKAALQKSPISSDHAFEVKFLNTPHFDPNWHFHSEYQLFVVLKGTGTRFIGDHVSPFKKGDMVFTGPDLPHLWRSDMEYFEGDKNFWTEGIVIYFHEHFLGNEFLQKKEMYLLRQLFIKAQRGMEIVGGTAEKAEKLMLDLSQTTDFESILILLNLLNLLSCTNDYNLLASAGYTNSLKESDTERMNKVHAYVMKNFREKITLEEVAAIANMTPTSFSRYFKTHANKTFSDFLTEIRVGYSCKLLIEKKMNVSQICYDSGFYTLSNFNRQFKAVTHYNPLEYRRKYTELTYSS
jgi:AraC-like DNA-binding protein/quercetin dioxygenase-like cupin family protein